MPDIIDITIGATRVGGAAHSGPMPVRLVEPPVIELPVLGNLTVWHFPEDGSVVIRKGSPEFATADCLCIDAHELVSLGRTLMALGEAQEK